MRKIIAWVLGWEVIWVQQFNGKVYRRLAQPTPYGLVAYTHSRVFDIGCFVCLPDGTCSGDICVTSWKAA